METIYNYINGELIAPRKGNYLQVFAPSTGQPYAKVPNSCSEDVDQAFESANKAFDNWSELTSNERGDYLIAIANELEKKIDFFFRGGRRQSLARKKKKKERVEDSDLHVLKRCTTHS